jgi:hypothetical protein
VVRSTFTEFFAATAASAAGGIGRTGEIIGVRDPGIRASIRLLKRRR